MYRIYSEGYIIIEQTEFSFSLRYFYSFVPPPDPIHEPEQAKAQCLVPLQHVLGERLGRWTLPNKRVVVIFKH